MARFSKLFSTTSFRRLKSGVDHLSIRSQLTPLDFSSPISSVEFTPCMNIMPVHGDAAMLPPPTILQFARNAVYYNETSGNSAVGLSLQKPLPPNPNSGKISGWTLGYPQIDFYANAPKAAAEFTAALDAAINANQAGYLPGVGLGDVPGLAADITAAAGSTKVNLPNSWTIGEVNLVLLNSMAAQSAVTSFSNTFFQNSYNSLNNLLWSQTGNLYAPVQAAIQDPTVYAGLAIVSADYNNQININRNGAWQTLLDTGTANFGPGKGQPITISPTATPEQVLSTVLGAYLSTSQASTTFANACNRWTTDIANIDAWAIANKQPLLGSVINVTSPFGTCVADINFISNVGTVSYNGTSTASGHKPILVHGSVIIGPISVSSSSTVTINNANSTSTVETFTPQAPAVGEIDTYWSGPNGTGTPGPMVEYLNATLGGIFDVLTRPCGRIAESRA